MFSVFKPRAALAEVVEAWTVADGPARTAIEMAMLDLERRLQEDPYGHGESRGDGSRVLFLPPLAVLVEIDDDRRLVRVVRAWTFRRLAA